jgi:hypothetical protein
LKDKDYFFIYNPEQIKYFINECNLKIIDFGTGNKGDAFIKFYNNNEFQKAFMSWKRIKYGDKAI